RVLFRSPVVSHLVPEMHVHLVAAIPNGLTVEYMPWTLRLFEETPAIEHRQLVVPKKPGLGLAFGQGTVKRYQAGCGGSLRGRGAPRPRGGGSRVWCLGEIPGL